MRPLPLLAALLLATGCASPGAPGGGEVDAEGGPERPEFFSGLPPAVLAGRAVFDLESGDPARMGPARCTLLALEPGALHAWRVRAAATPVGSEQRRAVLAVLADRGEDTGEFPDAEVVASSIDEVLSDTPGRRGTLLAAVRMRELGEAALPALFDEARAGGRRGTVAVRFLRLLGVPDRDLPVVLP